MTDEMLSLSLRISSDSGRSAAAPFYHLIPKDLNKNLEWRREMALAGGARGAMRRALYVMCTRDPLFFINTFCWLFEPRGENAGPCPFNTYEFQDRVILEICQSLGKTDIGIEKSRDMGMSWVMLTVFFWRWMFRKTQSFLIVSRNEDLVDKTGDTDTLFWKLDQLYEYLPGWLKPQRNRTRLNFQNIDNGSVINGASTTGNIGRGGRRTALLLDEYGAFPTDYGYAALSATQAVTDCRVFLSTPQGGAGAYYDVMHDPDLDLYKIRLHWSEHPHKKVGLYTSNNGKLEILDKQYKFPAGYKFICDDKLRSPWYDRECRRCPVPQHIAQELDIDYLGSSYLFFDRDMIRMVIKRDARPPYRIGELQWESDEVNPRGFADEKHGRFRLWCHPDARGLIPGDRKYVLGCDPSFGSVDEKGRGASNSVMVLADRETGEKIGEFAGTGIKPHQLAEYAVAICKWATDADGVGALLIWEGNGPGLPFANEVKRLGYRHVYYRGDETAFSVQRRTNPGWWSTHDSKRILLSEYQRAIATGEFVNRSEVALEECEYYVVLPDGRIEHLKATTTIDPTGARANHGDRVIADAVTWYAIKNVQLQPEAEEQQVPPSSFLARRLEREQQEKEHALW